MSYIRVVDNKSADTLVIMSSADVPYGKFSGSRAFSKLDVNLIFVNCPNNSWYLSPIPELGNSVSEISSSLHKLIDSTNPTKVGFYGGSMGGYGALLYGCLLNSDFVLATGVEVNIGLKGGYFSRYNLIESSQVIPDICSIVSSSSTNVTLVVGEESSVDLYCARMLQSFSNVDIKTIVNGEHVVPKFLHREFGVDRIIKGYIDKGAFDLLQFYCGKILSYDKYADYLYLFDYEKIDKSDFFEKCTKYLDKLDGISLSYYLYRAASAFKRQDEFSKKHELLKAANHLNGSNSKIYSLLSQSYFDLENYEKSIEYATRAIEMSDPFIGKPNYNAYFCLFRNYQKLGKKEEAFSTLVSLEKKSPKIGPIKARLDRAKKSLCL